jgi:mono/diheme cytochrome c family protein
MNATTITLSALAAALVAVAATTAAPGADRPAASVDAVARGKYLVTSYGCSDCHTPWKLGPNGPEPDSARAFSGHPQELVMPPAPALPAGPWMITVSGTNTAWAGPWGVSYTANLTPDPETGLGRWTEMEFVDTLRSGRHMGRGREILPPMPWQAASNLSDEDLRAMFAYLKSLPAIKNRVPEPAAPAANR